MKLQKLVFKVYVNKKLTVVLVGSYFISACINTIDSRLFGSQLFDIRTT